MPLFLIASLHHTVLVSRLTFIGSINPKLSPNTASTSTTTTPGKEQLALPAPEHDAFPYEVEEVEEPVDSTKEAVRRF